MKVGDRVIYQQADGVYVIEKEYDCGNVFRIGNGKIFCGMVPVEMLKLWPAVGDEVIHLPDRHIYCVIEVGEQIIVEDGKIVPVEKLWPARSRIDVWANFLFNEKLDPHQLRIEDVLELLELAEALAEKGRPNIRMHKEKIESRKLVVNTAFDLGIDLMDMKNKWSGKRMIGRGLLDIWNKLYIERFGANYGTTGRLEAIRRDVKTRLAKKRREAGNAN